MQQLWRKRSGAICGKRTHRIRPAEVTANDPAALQRPRTINPRCDEAYPDHDDLIPLV